ncbi:hypothetical protein Ae201684P_007878 [Aphanomyces euteiches]|nr:hypothetical protein Ae201684P_007878 [Aphanomyces euteiches]KAH9146370.1 hypothetical protein AeRB84_009740 [Aphanomyces euteiches]
MKLAARPTATTFAKVDADDCVGVGVGVAIVVPGVVVGAAGVETATVVAAAVVGGANVGALVEVGAKVNAVALLQLFTRLVAVMYKFSPVVMAQLPSMLAAVVVNKMREIIAER